MRRGVLLLVCLVAAHAQTPPLSFEDVGTVQGTCGIMASGGSFHWWFNDLHNQINHAARLTIVEYGTNGNRPFTRAFFTGRSIQPTQRIGNLVMWTLNGFAQTTSTECKVRSAATESHSYTGGQCGALGFLQQNGNSQMLQGNLIEHVGPLQATTYVSIEDCCLRCANPPTAVASTATARQLQEVDSCQGLGYEEVADTYLSGGTDTAWTTGTPVHLRDVDCCHTCSESPGCAGFSIYQGRCYLTLGNYISTAYTGARAFKIVSGRVALRLSPPPPSAGNMLNSAFAHQVSQGQYTSGDSRTNIPSGSISNFAPRISGSTSTSRNSMCTDECVKRHAVAGVEYTLQIVHHRQRRIPLSSSADVGVPASQYVDHIRCYCYAHEPDVAVTTPYREFRSNYVMLHYSISNKPPSPPPPPNPPPLPPDNTECKGFVVEGQSCKLYSSNVLGPVSSSGITSSVWRVAFDPPPPPTPPSPPPKIGARCDVPVRGHFVAGATVEKVGSTAQMPEDCPAWCASIASIECELRDELISTSAPKMRCAWKEGRGCYAFAGANVHELAGTQPQTLASGTDCVLDTSTILPCNKDRYMPPPSPTPPAPNPPPPVPQSPGVTLGDLALLDESAQASILAQRSQPQPQAATAPATVDLGTLTLAGTLVNVIRMEGSARGITGERCCDVNGRVELTQLQCLALGPILSPAAQSTESHDATGTVPAESGCMIWNDDYSAGALEYMNNPTESAPCTANYCFCANTGSSDQNCMGGGGLTAADTAAALSGVDDPHSTLSTGAGGGCLTGGTPGDASTGYSLKFDVSTDPLLTMHRSVYSLPMSDLTDGSTEVPVYTGPSLTPSSRRRKLGSIADAGQNSFSGCDDVVFWQRVTATPRRRRASRRRHHRQPVSLLAPGASSSTAPGANYWPGSLRPVPGRRLGGDDDGYDWYVHQADDVRRQPRAPTRAAFEGTLAHTPRTPSWVSTTVWRTASSTTSRRATTTSTATVRSSTRTSPHAPTATQS